MPPTAGTFQHVSLHPHPLSGPGALTRLTVDVGATAAGLALTYVLEGDLARLEIPPQTQAGPADRLWAHTCCEAFIAAPSAPSYREFNFSPSGQWAIYDFADYRVANGVPTDRLQIECAHDRQRLVLTTRLPRTVLPADDHDSIELGLSCVVEDTCGHLSYWAITHPSDRPDFHHRAGFALRLPLPSAQNT